MKVEPYCLERISEGDLSNDWDSDVVFTTMNKDIKRDMLALSTKSISGVFYDNDIGRVTRSLDSATCLAFLWDGGNLYAMAIADTNNYGFLLTKYNCSAVENWLCYGNCSKLLGTENITQTIVGRNGITMLRRKTSR